MGGANIQNVHYFEHGYLEEEKSMVHSFTVTFGAKYLASMVTSVPPYEIRLKRLIKNNILHQSKIYKNHFENSNFWGMWPLGVSHVTYSLKIMLFVSMGIFYDKLHPQILTVVPAANSPLRYSWVLWCRWNLKSTPIQIFHWPWTSYPFISSKYIIYTHSYTFQLLVIYL